jgi:hypothetical protein
VLNILNSLRKWTASALSLAHQTPLRSVEFDTASDPCLSGGTDQINPPFQEPAAMDMKPAIVRHLDLHPGSGRAAIAAALGIDAITASRELRSLVRGGVLTMSGSKRGSRYSLAAPLPPAA